VHAFTPHFAINMVAKVTRELTALSADEPLIEVLYDISNNPELPGICELSNDQTAGFRNAAVAAEV
jgi:hypothetical protein